jgi:hypothetical protein
MEIVALLVAAFLQLASLSFDQLRETVEAINVEVRHFLSESQGK